MIAVRLEVYVGGCELTGESNAQLGLGYIVASSLERELPLDSLRRLKRWRMVEGGDVIDSDSVEMDVLEETALPREKKGTRRCHVGSRGSE